MTSAASSAPDDVEAVEAGTNVIASMSRTLADEAAWTKQPEPCEHERLDRDACDVDELAEYFARQLGGWNPGLVAGLQFNATRTQQHGLSNPGLVAKLQPPAILAEQDRTAESLIDLADAVLANRFATKKSRRVRR